MILPSPLPDHPRLLVREQDWGSLREKLETDPPSAMIYRTLRQRADAILAEPPVERDLTGRMLLMISRQALERISVLAIVDRVSAESRYGTRAIAEMVAVCRFIDWNPSHFLDTAELCLAVAIGFDWLYERLTREEREEIATALTEKGIRPSLDSAASTNWWLTTDENWAQVCHAGLSAAAIALAERAPELAEAVIARAIAALPKVAANYAPDGAYPEGPMYWSYGTAYHVVLAAALHALTGSAQGLDSFPGFAESADYINAVTAPSGDYFNYADCAARRRIQAQLFWMSAHYDRPEWLAHDLSMLERDLREYREVPSAQYWYYDMVALALLWRKPVTAEAPSRQPHWSGGGKMPVATYRWGDRNFFLGVKGGSVGLSHSHMDVGSFVFEASGVRWAVDTGMQDYAGLEAANVDLWNERDQDSQRWSIFRIGPESHNILRFGESPPKLLQVAPLIATATSCLIDLAATLGVPFIAATRRFALHPDGFSIADSWSAEAAVPIRSQWLTFADVETDGQAVVLRQNGKHLRLETEASVPLSIIVEDRSPPLRSFDAPNPGLKRLSLACEAASGSIYLRAVSG